MGNNYTARQSNSVFKIFTVKTKKFLKSRQKYKKNSHSKLKRKT